MRPKSMHRPRSTYHWGEPQLAQGMRLAQEAAKRLPPPRRILFFDFECSQIPPVEIGPSGFFSMSFTTAFFRLRHDWHLLLYGKIRLQLVHHLGRHLREEVISLQIHRAHRAVDAIAREAGAQRHPVVVEGLPGLRA